MTLCKRWTGYGLFSLVILCRHVQAAETVQTGPRLVPPLANAVLSPALKAAADRDHISLSSHEVQSIAPSPGDAVVFWIGATHDNKNEQWLLQLKRGTATPEEQKANRGNDVKRYLSWGPVITFHSEIDALDLWIAGPVNTGDNANHSASPAPLPTIRHSRVFVPRDYLRLGLDDSVRASQFMNRRIQAILKEEPTFGFGHIYSLEKPIKPENVAYAKPVAERIGFTPAMEQAWTGGYVALDAFYKLVNDLPDLRDIADIALRRPAPWKLVKLAFGTYFKTYFGGLDSQLIEPATMGLLPVALESFEAPFSFTFGDELIVSGAMAVTSSATPLDVSAGILGIVAIHPTDKTRMVQLVAISASRGNAKGLQKP